VRSREQTLLGSPPLLGGTRLLVSQTHLGIDLLRVGGRSSEGRRATRSMGRFSRSAMAVTASSPRSSTSRAALMTSRCPDPGRAPHACRMGPSLKNHAGVLSHPEAFVNEALSRYTCLVA